MSLNDIVFEPRNRGIHKFELVEEKEAKHAYELAMLTIRNCVHRVPPADAPIFYGNLSTYSGIEEVATKIPREEWFRPIIEHAFYFEGIGDVGDHGVLIERTRQRLSVLENVGDGKLTSRFSKLRNKFTSSQIREIFEHLENGKPKALEYSEDDLRHVFDVLMPDGREQYTQTIAKPRRKRTVKKR